MTLARSHARKLPSVEQATPMLATTANNALTSYSRAQAISSEHVQSADVYVYDWPSRQPTA